MLLCSARAQDMYWTEEAKSAHGLITQLRIEEGLTIIRLMRITQPDNYIWPYLEDYGLFLQIFVQEDLRSIGAYIEASAIRQNLLYAVPETNPLSLMAQAQIHLHHCALRLQQGQFLTAGSEINKAFKLLKRNQKLHPNDVANLRLYAALKVVFGAIPDQYRWLVSIVTSLSGSIEEGVRELKQILTVSHPTNNVFYNETILFLAIADGRLNNQAEAGLGHLYRYFGKAPTQRPVQFIMAELLIETGDTDGAIRLLSTPPGVGVISIPFMEFLLGECKLNRGDADADKYFLSFLSKHKGKHFIKESYQKLAWHALLKEDRNGYFHYMQQILIKGSNMTDEDKQAMLEAEEHATPHPHLLRARLFYDGGYYEKALALLEDDLFNGLTQQAHRLEFLYRKGRILQARKSHAEALHYYSLTISSGQFERYYFACAAALQSGLIHETLGSHSAAAKYYYMCIDMQPETYASSLHQKARMGLNRVE